ncbi:hypothetical protein [Klebsiella pneumoniae IS39]|nr:hypothetical protein [Klebsiella pneumoniae IS39]
MVLAEYSQRQYSQISNTVEQYLIDALFGLKVESQYAGQKNIDFLAGNAKNVLRAECCQYSKRI